ncbi:MAG: NAD-dependent epimerase/dehydratase family protein [Armatimonadota bacterium]
MHHRHVLITGGAGFIGSNLAIHLRLHFPDVRVVVLDNLKRRGSELNLPRLRSAGVRFVHGDIRATEDLEFPESDPFDLIVECSAEPSVLAGYARPSYVVDTNLVGTMHCLELARRHRSDLVFLSTSRVYPLGALRALKLHETETRFEIAADQEVPGAGPEGISEDFPLGGARSLYGATKLASELLLEEYRAAYGLRAVVNRCGVVAGPWQMGKVDQGVFSLWLLMHLFDRPLRYIGFGGQGKQVRDVLHVDDLCDLVVRQAGSIDRCDGAVWNVGGGRAASLSLRETTDLCRRITGKKSVVEGIDEERPGDLPVYITDHSRVTEAIGWSPRRSAEDVLTDLHDWAVPRLDTLRGILEGDG